MGIQGVITFTPGTALTDDDAGMLVSGRDAASVDKAANTIPCNCDHTTDASFEKKYLTPLTDTLTHTHSHTHIHTHT